MGQTVYGDLLFLINFSMDFLVLFITSRLLSVKLRPLRAALAAAIGGVYGVGALFLDVSRLVVGVCDVGVAFLICAVAFWHRGERLGLFLWRGAVFFGVSLLLGGIMSGFFAILGRMELLAPDVDGEDDISVWLFALLAAAGSAAALVGGRRLRTLSQSKRVKITINVDGKCVTLTAMTDTGNMLYDPLGGRAVVICELDAVEEIFEHQLVSFWRDGDISGVTALDAKFSSCLRFIPAKGALSGKVSMLCAVAPDSFSVCTESDEHECDVLIAPVPFALSAGESRAIIPPGLIQ